jgi:hypothetical protein
MDRNSIAFPSDEKDEREVRTSIEAIVEPNTQVVISDVGITAFDPVLCICRRRGVLAKACRLLEQGRRSKRQAGLDQ